MNITHIEALEGTGMEGYGEVQGMAPEDISEI